MRTALLAAPVGRFPPGGSSMLFIGTMVPLYQRNSLRKVIQITQVGELAGYSAPPNSRPQQGHFPGGKWRFSGLEWWKERPKRVILFTFQLLCMFYNLLNQNSLWRTVH